MPIFIGPMSKNIVDTAIQFQKINKSSEIVFIPSRRQIEYNGGYVNNWTTKDFVRYVKSKNSAIKIQRDHGGPSQGLLDDDGYESLSEDIKYMDIIHIDPWKKYTLLHEGIGHTIKMLKYCHSLNPTLLYEIGTEESIRYFTVEEIETLIIAIKQNVSTELYKQIKYVVIQCGTNLCERKNTGNFDNLRLKQMLDLVYSYGFEAKEHNGDWVSKKIYDEKKKHGIKNINIAPELGEIETSVILDTINEEEYELLFNLCYTSNKWKKWVNTSFDPFKNKKETILISCHYIFSSKEFQEIKSKYINIDSKIQEKIYDKLLELYNIYTIRKECVLCFKNNFAEYFKNDLISTLSLGFNKIQEEARWMPFNLYVCNYCNTIQNKYLGNLDIIYSNNHIDTFGQTKNEMQTKFCKFITTHNNIDGIIEIGACHGSLAREILEDINTEYYIIEPSFTGDRSGLHVINNYIENENISHINANTFIMSNLFEHLYKPMQLLEQLQNTPNIKYIYINHPDFEHNVRNNTYVVLNCEHTFYLEHNVLINYFLKYGFKLKKQDNYKNHTIMFIFERIEPIVVEESTLINTYSIRDIDHFFNTMTKTINYLNNYMKDTTKKYYIWPASAHSISLFTNGLDYTRLDGMLDNSPNKVGKYLYGYNLLCSSFEEKIKTTDENICIIISGAGSYIDEIVINNSKITFIKTNDLNT